VPASERIGRGLPIGTWESSRGEVRVFGPARGIYLTYARGHADGIMANGIVESGNLLLESNPKLEVFHDFEGLDSYETEARVRLTQWGIDIRHRVTRIHVLVRSKLAKMGVAVASIALAGLIKAYDDRAEFESALDAAIRAASPLTSPPPASSLPPARGRGPGGGS
jgi:hypothetical protein